MNPKETLTAQAPTLPRDGVASEPTERTLDTVAVSALELHLCPPFPPPLRGSLARQSHRAGLRLSPPRLPKYRSKPEAHGVSTAIRTSRFDRLRGDLTFLVLVRTHLEAAEVM
jgi:hypothetical protein